MAGRSTSVDSPRVTARVVDSSLIEVNDWNPNVMPQFEYGKLIESIKKYGFTDPLTVRPTEGGYQVIDGEHRLYAARDIGIDEIPIVDVGNISDDDAKALGIILNELKGQHDPKKLGALLDDLVSRGTAEEVLKGMPFTEDALKGMTNLANFDWESITPSESANPSPKKGISWVERTFRIPHEVNEVLNDALDRAKDGDDIEDWQALERIAADFLGGA